MKKCKKEINPVLYGIQEFPSDKEVKNYVLSEDQEKMKNEWITSLQTTKNGEKWLSKHKGVI